MSQNTVSTYFFTRLLDFISPLCVINNDERFNTFKKAVEYYTYYTFTIDALVDGEIAFEIGVPAAEHKLVKANRSNTQSLRILARLFDENSRFWNIMETYMSAYYCGLVLEKQHNTASFSHSLESFKAYALAKHAPAFVPSGGLLLLFESQIDQKRLEKLLTPLFYGMQMLDDLEDFDKDIESGQLTYCISRVRSYIEKEGVENPNNLQRFEERVFYLSGIARECNDFAEEQFQKARAEALNLQLYDLVSWIESMFKMLEHNRNIIDEVSK
ncbi:hypothetical protein [Leeuwenhoekiella nanhaiensis]|uniref:Phytoene synthase n=1 Tax=Leeuwenhoekiella nanhaiensis TaxID=1655491 RepID=A0A2G1VMU6_9FLAO|nr:hypothetical protein [Leeuwenhoekiella nanhaiensis]PHQ28083.1 hypothetical protein CJ305_16840 [Leeuwenhoekiella nanhaiensis]